MRLGAQPANINARVTIEDVSDNSLKGLAQNADCRPDVPDGTTVLIGTIVAALPPAGSNPSSLPGFQRRFAAKVADEKQSKRRTLEPMAVLGFEAANPKGYGRLITKGKAVTDIREELDATPTCKPRRLASAR